ncbi:MAG: hypothetical protein K0A92_10415, partial [Methyloprofundus sp.]|nr:hypothetical protein [Methyloprofundus sp.]
KNADSVNEVRLKIKLSKESSDDEMEHDFAIDAEDSMIDNRNRRNTEDSAMSGGSLSLQIDDDEN